MKYRLIVRAKAEADITDAAIWYHNQQPGLGHEFIEEVEKAIQNAVLNPRLYPLMLRHPEVRKVLTKRFPYRIFYTLSDDAAIVFRILHAARHDREWKEGLEET